MSDMKENISKARTLKASAKKMLSATRKVLTPLNKFVSVTWKGGFPTKPQKKALAKAYVIAKSAIIDLPLPVCFHSQIEPSSFDAPFLVEIREDLFFIQSQWLSRVSIAYDEEDGWDVRSKNEQSKLEAEIRRIEIAIYRLTGVIDSGIVGFN